MLNLSILLSELVVGSLQDIPVKQTGSHDVRKYRKGFLPFLPYTDLSSVLLCQSQIKRIRKVKHAKQSGSGFYNFIKDLRFGYSIAFIRVSVCQSQFNILSI
jgi:hypothetical protein